MTVIHLSDDSYISKILDTNQEFVESVVDIASTSLLDLGTSSNAPLYSASSPIAVFLRVNKHM